MPSVLVLVRRRVEYLDFHWRGAVAVPELVDLPARIGEDFFFSEQLLGGSCLQGLRPRRLRFG